jgi:glutathione S-transferase
MSNLTLYGAPDSGHSFKVALTLRLLELPYAYRRVELSQPRAERPEDFRLASPYGEVPVLVIDGRPLAQSNAILLHLARTTGRLGGGDLDQVTQWLFWEANRIGLSLPNYRLYKRFFPAPPDVIAWLADRLEADLTRLDEALSERPWLLGEAMTVVDVACSAYLAFHDQIDLDLARWPRLQAWFDRIRALPEWSHPYEVLG